MLRLRVANFSLGDVMSRSKLSLVAAGTMLAGALSFSLPPVESAQAQDAGAVAAGVVSGIAGAFLFGGHNYCWYDNGWNGGGWYWCGYGYNYGYGYGGPVGWHGWAWRGGRPPGYRPGWRGAPPHGWSGGPGHWNHPGWRGGAMHGGAMHGGAMHGGAMHGGAMRGGAMRGGHGGGKPADHH